MSADVKPAAGPRVLLAVGLAVAAAVRVRIAFGDDGIFWPDEIYQSLEPAHRLVFGYGMVAWEFIDGARNWALPGLIAALMKVASTLGLNTPGGYLGFVHLSFIALSLLTAAGVARLAKSFGASALWANAAALSFALCGPVIYFSHRAMAETACMAPVVWGLAWVLEPSRTRRGLLVGASLLGLSVLLRLQCGLFCVGALGVLAARKEWKPAREVLGVLVVWAFLFGALDHFTWADAPGAKYGGWFHSALKYFQFNVIEGKGSQWGVAPPGFYVQRLFSAMPALSVVLVAALALSARRAWPVVTLAVAFVAAHSAIAHKEWRFILPALPLLFACVGIALDEVKGMVPSRIAVLAVVGASLFSFFTHSSLTFGELGAYPERAGASAWDDFGPVNRLMKAASAREDLCGLRIDTAHLAWTGGSTYLHRNAPLYMPGTPHQYGWFNYLVTFPGSGLEVIAKDGALELVKLPVQCTPNAGYSWRLP